MQKVVFDGLLLSCVGIFLRGISVFFNIWLTREIGAEAMGLLTLIGSVYGFSVTFSVSGIHLCLVRLLSSALTHQNAQKSVSDLLRHGFFYGFSFSLVASVTLFVSANAIAKYLLHDMRTVSSLQYLALSLVPIAISTVLNAYFCAVRRVYKNSIVQVAEQCVKMALTVCFLFLLSVKDEERFCKAVIVSGVVSEILSLFVHLILYGFDRKRHTEEKGLLPSKEYSFDTVFFSAFPLGVSSYVRSLLVTAEHLLIPWGLQKSGQNVSSALSSYGILHGMVFPLLLFPACVPSSFISLLIPELCSESEQRNESKITRTVSKIFSFSFLFSFGVAGLFIAFADEIGLFFYGKSEVAYYLKTLAPLLPLMYLDSIVDTVLKGLGEQLYCMRVNIIDSLLSVILLFTLLPRYGMRGYLVVIFITEIYNVSFSLFKLLEKTDVKTPLVRWIIKPILCIVASSLAVCFLPTTSVFFFFCKIGLFLLSYGLFSRLFGVLDEGEIDLAKQVFKRSSH